VDVSKYALAHLTISKEMLEVYFANALFLGITFSATCADVPKKMQMKKYGSVNQGVKHVDNALAWTGNIGPQDWLEVA
jgi:hypothetical protein